MNKEQINLEETLNLLDKARPTCMDYKGVIYPIMYDNDPVLHCAFNAGCPYKHSYDMETKNFCSYYSTMSVMLGKQLEFDFNDN